MKTLGSGLAAHVAAAATTLCRCWCVTRRDGIKMGFTDHDEALSFDGVTFAAAGGLEASADVAGSDLAVGGMEVAGAFSADSLRDDDLAAGRYDGAAVALWLVNWASPADRVLLRSGVIGTVTRRDGAFTAEVRGLAQNLDEVRGRTIGRGCDALLGDGRCRRSLADLQADVTVTATDGPARLRLSGAGGRAGGWFTHGVAAFLSGENAGLSFEIRYHGETGGSLIELWQVPAGTVAAGDRVRLTAGCDKQFSTCRGKFANGDNFRGFPHVPGNDFALFGATGSSADGSTLI
ncbi:DUF2163 domain-containing protein [Pseudoxanthobacter sp.]|uniref:DUF2163 domain-containing protein n=1 Tax=Pseudoxanthobacter sp. TaxID=1925742 RepID=UPI002FE243A3